MVDLINQNPRGSFEHTFEHNWSRPYLQSVGTLHYTYSMNTIKVSQKSVSTLAVGDRFQQHHMREVLGDAAPVYTVQKKTIIGLKVILRTDKGIMRMNLAGSVQALV